MHYDTIAKFPLWNWRQCLDGDYTFTRLDPDKGDDVADFLAWEKLYNEYLAQYGLGEDQNRIFELKIDLAMAQMDYVMDGNTFLLNNIKRLQRELKEILEKPVEGGFDECLVYLSKWLGYHFDQKIRTVTEFHSSMNMYQKECALLREQTQKAS